MSERRRTNTDAESVWTHGRYAVPPPSGAVEGAEWKAGYRYLARFTRRNGAPVADCLIIFGPDINAAALRAMSLRADLAMAAEQPDKAWRDDHDLDRALSEVEAAEQRTWRRGSGSRDAATSPRPPLSRPDGTDPAGFAARVAQAYREAARRTNAPAKALADEAGVPVTTVHRWIREARRLGALGPATGRGRVG